MNVLEKISEEIKALKLRRDNSNRDYYVGYMSALSTVEGIIAGVAKMETSAWVPVANRLPEEHNSVFARFKGTDKWNNAMFGKMSDKVNVTIEFIDGYRTTITSYTIDGKWKCEKEPSLVKKKVIAWQPLPEPYKV